jgi:hypothetical protein
MIHQIIKCPPNVDIIFRRSHIFIIYKISTTQDVGTYKSILDPEIEYHVSPVRSRSLSHKKGKIAYYSKNIEYQDELPGLVEKAYCDLKKMAMYDSRIHKLAKKQAEFELQIEEEIKKIKEFPEYQRIYLDTDKHKAKRERDRIKQEMAHEIEHEKIRKENERLVKLQETKSEMDFIFITPLPTC